MSVYVYIYAYICIFFFYVYATEMISVETVEYPITIMSLYAKAFWKNKY